jgi:SulP family sulfate permease
MMIFVLLFGPLAELIPMAALAALLMVIGIEVMLKEWPGMIMSWKISRLRSVAMIAVIIVGVVDDLTVAIFVGVLLSLGIYVYESATKASSYELFPVEGRLEERPVREKLASNEVAIMQLEGNIYFASVYSFDEFLPDVSGAHNSVVILRERDRDTVNLTAIEWIEKHAKTYREQGNRMMYSGLSEDTVQLYRELGVLEEVGEENIFIKQDRLGASTFEAYEAAKAWIEENRSSD